MMKNFTTNKKVSIFYVDKKYPKALDCLPPCYIGDYKNLDSISFIEEDFKFLPYKKLYAKTTIYGSNVIDKYVHYYLFKNNKWIRINKYIEADDL